MLTRKKNETKEKDLGRNFHMRINDDLRRKIEAKALNSGITLSEAVRVALNDFLHKDININTEILGTLSSIEKEIEYLQRQLELHSNLFVYFLRFFFAFSGKEIESIPKDARKQFFDKGEKRRDDFIRLFKQQNISHVNIFEMMMNDLVAGDTKEKGMTDNRNVEDEIGVGE